jgi:hypothetical protein
VVGVVGDAGHGAKAVEGFFNMPFRRQGSLKRGVVGVATGVDSPELKDGEGGRGAMLGVGKSTRGLGVRLRGIGGGAGN